MASSSCESASRDLEQRNDSGFDQAYQLPYLPTIPRQSASRSRAKDSLPTLAFLAAAVITITSLSWGSTKMCRAGDGFDEYLRFARYSDFERRKHVKTKDCSPALILSEPIRL